MILACFHTFATKKQIPAEVFFYFPTSAEQYDQNIISHNDTKSAAVNSFCKKKNRIIVFLQGECAMVLDSLHIFSYIRKTNWLINFSLPWGENCVLYYSRQ